MEQIATQWAKEQREKNNKKKMKMQSSFGFTIIKKAFLFNLSKSGICKYNANGYKVYKEDLIDFELRRIADKKSLTNSFGSKRYIIGRRMMFGEVKDSIALSARQIGNRMTRLGIGSKIRSKRREREVKSINQEGENIANRDYYSNNIVSTDTSYLNQTSERSNHVYILPAIHWGSRFILGFELSKYNDEKLLMTALKNSRIPKGTITTSDRGSLYESKAYLKHLKQNGLVKSLSRKGNCWDNLPIENWFGTLKSECLNHYNLNDMSFKELKNLIKKWIYKYNFERKQEKLGWKTPAEVLAKIPSYMVHF